MIYIVIPILWCIVLYIIITNILLFMAANKIYKNPNISNTQVYIKRLKFTPIQNRPNEWQKLKALFHFVNNSNSIDYNTKLELYNGLSRKGCILGNAKVKSGMEFK